MSDTIRVISAEELKAKLDKGDEFRLVNALGDWEFNAKHIAGSEHFGSFEETVQSIGPDEEVVVYCTNVACRASQKLYRDLVARGYKGVSRFAGGLEDWEDRGYPLEGEDF